MINLKLPFWLSGSKPQALLAVTQAWWGKVESWLTWPLRQLDIDLAALAVVDLFAWERGIERFEAEPETLYRKRVKYAFINAQDAGSVAGFQRIFERLDIGYVEVQERVAGEDWDIVYLLLNDSQIAQNTQLLQVIIRLYGRTCRRYIVNSISTSVAYVNVQPLSDNQETIVATL